MKKIKLGKIKPVKRSIKDVVCRIIWIVENLLQIAPMPLTILCYHSVCPVSSIVDIDPSSFFSQMKYLQKHFQILPIETVERYIRNEVKLDKPSVVITFDDGYKNIFTTVAPYFKRHKIPATVFVVSNPANVNRAELENEKDLLSWNEVKKLSEIGWTIGSHTKTHPNLASLSNSEIYDEVVNAKQEIEKKIDKDVHYFAYPKGIAPERAVSACRKAKYKLALTTKVGKVSAGENYLRVQRMCVDSSHSQDQFPLLLSPFGVYYFQVRKKIVERFL